MDPAARRELARSAGLAGLATLASRMLGLARDQVLAAVFGAGNEMDAFVVAFRIPNLVRDLFAEGAMSAALVPTFTRELVASGKPRAWRLGNNLLNANLLLTGALVALGLVFARELVTAYAAGYGAVPGKLGLTVQLTRVMLPFLTLVAVAAVLMGMLNSLNHYFLPALSPAMFNIATILSALVLVPVMRAAGLPAIMAVAIGALVGGIGQIAVQGAPLWREGFRYRPLIDLRDPGLRRVLILMGPGTVGLAATQVNLFVNTLLATGEGTGAASWLSYAFRLIYLPIGLFGVSIATAVLPSAARHAAEGNLQAIRQTVSRGMTLMLMLNVPATFGLVVLATPIVRLLFERGEFLPQDTAATAAALRLYAVGLIGYATARIATPIFYTLGRSRIPVAISTMTIAVNIVAAVLLVQVAGFRGLALATSLAALANGGSLLLFLRRTLRGLEGRRLATTFVKVLAASVVMTGVAASVEQLFASAVPGSALVLQALRLAAAVGAGLVTLVAAAKFLRIRELDEALGMLRERVQKLLDS